VGPTVACILGQQFRNLMNGDRFFFTHPNDGSNNERGLDQADRDYVQARKLSNIICDNIPDGLSVINENVMDLRSPLVDCSSSSNSTKTSSRH